MTASSELQDESFMRLALNEAEVALDRGEVPVGCVFVDDQNNVITVGHNMTNESKNGTRHAELVALDKLLFDADVEKSKLLETLRSSRLYVTCEPCIMCAAALSKIGIRHVFFGCHNDRFGGNGSILSVHSDPLLSTYSYAITSGLMKRRGGRCISKVLSIRESKSTGKQEEEKG
eukprot:CAMPEP_0175024612 /NCGR_PEP_ID=MMETSP0005-20121125/16568_1 /TAXON_ID=420556 /ORGANISM="Ochromonas sp., Strain CCMP1393" /LENGTH=174 /DNA_ID=CAMNT_0016283193 /DNA_START=20 /DNA_END=547 /DNA_ORIENTATION=+